MQSPGSKNNSKKRAEKGPAQRLRQRTAILILLILVLGFGAAVLRLTYLTTVQSSELQESAVDLQLAELFPQNEEQFMTQTAMFLPKAHRFGRW